MSILHSPAFVNSAWVSSVFLLGYFCIRIHMPPMLGFLLAGFLMNFLGLTAGDLPLEQIADLGGEPLEKGFLRFQSGRFGVDRPQGANR